MLNRCRAIHWTHDDQDHSSHITGPQWVKKISYDTTKSTHFLYIDPPFHNIWICEVEIFGLARKPATDRNKLVIHIRSQVKTRQSQSYKFLKIAKNSNFEIWQEILHATHLKLLDTKCKYEMDLTKTVGATERTPDAGRMDGQTEWNQYNPPPPPTTYKNVTGICPRNQMLQCVWKLQD